MRGIIITRTGRLYITSEKPKLAEDQRFIVGELVPRGEVTVPIDNLEAVEFYDEFEIETFRTRYAELKETLSS